MKNYKTINVIVFALYLQHIQYYNMSNELKWKMIVTSKID